VFRIGEPEAGKQYSENLEEFLRNPILKIDITEPTSVFTSKILTHF
jgi:hypothetical protein